MIGGWAVCLLFLARLSATAAEPVLDFDYDPLTSVLTLSAPRDAQSYYTLEWTEDFETFSRVGLSLGDPAPVWAYSVAEDSPRGFFRVSARSVFSPQDTDGDGIDDRYELQHPDCLNPLDYLDASKPCLGLGLSNYQFYLREIFGGPGVALQFFSREETVFNFGQPSANHEAISQEISVYNANPGSGPPESDISQVYSRELTTWNFGSPSAGIEAISREATVWNFGAPAYSLEAFSKEVSVYNAMEGSGPPALADSPQVYSRELTVFNYGQPSSPVEAISREVTVLNFDEPNGQ